MPKVDLTVTISVIIAICAIISPIVTTLLNNHHLYKMRKLDDAAQLRKDSYFYKRGVYEDYLRYTSQCLTNPSASTLNEYGKTYALALIYFPDELQEQLIAINEAINHYMWSNALSDLNRIAPVIRKQIQKM